MIDRSAFDRFHGSNDDEPVPDHEPVAVIFSVEYLCEKCGRFLTGDEANGFEHEGGEDGSTG